MQKRKLALILLLMLVSCATVNGLRPGGPTGAIIDSAIKRMQKGGSGNPLADFLQNPETQGPSWDVHYELPLIPSVRVPVGERIAEALGLPPGQELRYRKELEPQVYTVQGLLEENFELEELNPVFTTEVALGPKANQFLARLGEKPIFDKPFAIGEKIAAELADRVFAKPFNSPVAALNIDELVNLGFERTFENLGADEAAEALRDLEEGFGDVLVLPDETDELVSEVKNLLSVNEHLFIPPGGSPLNGQEFSPEFLTFIFTDTQGEALFETAVFQSGTLRLEVANGLNTTITELTVTMFNAAGDELVTTDTLADPLGSGETEILALPLAGKSMQDQIYFTMTISTAAAPNGTIDLSLSAAGLAVAEVLFEEPVTVEEQLVAISLPVLADVRSLVLRGGTLTVQFDLEDCPGFTPEITALTIGDVPLSPIGEREYDLAGMALEWTGGQELEAKAKVAGTANRYRPGAQVGVTLTATGLEVERAEFNQPKPVPVQDSILIDNIVDLTLTGGTLHLNLTGAEELNLEDFTISLDGQELAGDLSNGFALAGLQLSGPAVELVVATTVRTYVLGIEVSVDAWTEALAIGFVEFSNPQVINGGWTEKIAFANEKLKLEELAFAAGQLQLELELSSELGIAIEDLELKLGGVPLAVIAQTPQSWTYDLAGQAVPFDPDGELPITLTYALAVSRYDTAAATDLQVEVRIAAVELAEFTFAGSELPLHFNALLPEEIQQFGTIRFGGGTLSLTVADQTGTPLVDFDAVLQLGGETLVIENGVLSLAGVTLSNLKGIEGEATISLPAVAYTPDLAIQVTARMEGVELDYIELQAPQTFTEDFAFTLQENIGRGEVLGLVFDTLVLEVLLDDGDLNLSPEIDLAIDGVRVLRREGNVFILDLSGVDIDFTGMEPTHFQGTVSLRARKFSKNTVVRFEAHLREVELGWIELAYTEQIAEDTTYAVASQEFVLGADKLDPQLREVLAKLTLNRQAIDLRLLLTNNFPLGLRTEGLRVTAYVDGQEISLLDEDIEIQPQTVFDLGAVILDLLFAGLDTLPDRIVVSDFTVKVDPAGRDSILISKDARVTYEGYCEVALSFLLKGGGLELEFEPQYLEVPLEELEMPEGILQEVALHIEVGNYLPLACGATLYFSPDQETLCTDPAYTLALNLPPAGTKGVIKVGITEAQLRLFQKDLYAGVKFALPNPTAIDQEITFSLADYLTLRAWVTADIRVNPRKEEEQ